MAKQFLIVGLVALGLLTGCSNSEEDASGSPEQVAETVVDTFATADPAIKQAADVTADALRNNEYEKAFASINVLSSNPNPTEEQQAAISASIETLHSQLAKAIVNGDTNANRVVQMMREARRR